MAELTESVSFRTTPELKMSYAEKAANLGISLSEYLTLCLKEYERIKNQIPSNPATALPVASSPVGEAPKETPKEEPQSENSFIPLSSEEGNEKLDLIIEMITDRLTPMAIDEVEKQNIINAARIDIIREFESNNLVIPTNAAVLASVEFRALFNKVLEFNTQKEICTNAMGLILELIFQTDYFGTLRMPEGTSRDIKAIRKMIKDVEEAAKPQTEEIEG